VTVRVCSPAGLRRCVVLTDHGGSDPRRLVEGLHKRGLQVHPVDDAPAVMVQLAQLPRQVLIVTSPRRQRDLVQLLAAVRRYYPATLCWQYDPDGRGLVPIPPPEQPAEQPAAQPEAPQPADVPQVTAEELAMLLGSDRDDSRDVADASGREDRTWNRQARGSRRNGAGSGS